MPHLLSNRGIILFHRGRRRLLPLSSEKPADHRTGTIHWAELGEAYEAQECGRGERPRSYSTLRGMDVENSSPFLAISYDSKNPPWLEILVPDPTSDEMVWTKSFWHHVAPAPISSGDDLMVGTAYVALLPDYGETYRVRTLSSDFVLSVKPFSLEIKVQTYVAYVKAEDERNAEINAEMSDNGTFAVEPETEPE